MDHFIEWLAEWAQESRRRQRGLMLLTAHRAKGLEFDHVVVLDGGWSRVGRREDTDSPRRLYYVAMTRARQTLTLALLPGPQPVLDVLTDEPSVLLRNGPALPSIPPPELSRHYRRLGLRDVFLSYAGYLGTNNPVHQAIAELSVGDIFQVRAEANRWQLVDPQGTVVGQLAGEFEGPAGMPCAFALVSAIVGWDRQYSDAQYQQRLSCDSWEVVVPELVFEPDS